MVEDQLTHLDKDIERTEVVGGGHQIQLVVMNLVVLNQMKIIGVMVTTSLVQSSRL